MTLRFEEILHTLKASTKGNIGGRERLMKLKKGVVKAQIDRAKKKMLEKHLGNTDNIFTVIDAVYAIGQTIKEKKGLKRNGKRIENKNQEGPNRRIGKLEKQIKELRHILAWTSNEIHRRKIKRKSTNKEKEILQKLKK